MGTKKFFSGKEESHIDLSELISIQTLYEINKKICEKYPYGVIFTIFIEDYEGKFIEGNHLELYLMNILQVLKSLLKLQIYKILLKL